MFLVFFNVFILGLYTVCNVFIVDKAVECYHAVQDDKKNRIRVAAQSGYFLSEIPIYLKTQTTDNN